MKVLCPVKNLLYGIELINSGADELYFGVVSNSWQKEIGFKSILNRRDTSMANISSYNEAKKLIDYAREKGVKTHITLNNSPNIIDMNLIKKEVTNAIKVKPDALIVKDIFIADIIREIDKDIEIHCSSLNQVLNTEAISYWIENFNISRMIFPRNISVGEIKTLCNAFPDLEFEIFIKNDWCYNSDGICSSLHSEGLKKGIPFVCHREPRYKTSDEDFNKKYLNLYTKMLDCKICMLSKLKNIKNLVSLKIVGRGKPLPIVINDLKFIQNSLKFLKLSENAKEYVDFNIKLHKKFVKKQCNYSGCEYYNLYYK